LPVILPHLMPHSSSSLHPKSWCPATHILPISTLVFYFLLPHILWQNDTKVRTERNVSFQTEFFRIITSVIITLHYITLYLNLHILFSKSKKNYILYSDVLTSMAMIYFTTTEIFAYPEF
jgi:hypothetical protein